MQQYHETKHVAAQGRQGSRLGKLIKRVALIAFAASVVGVVIYASTLPAVQKQLSGRRARMKADGPVAVTVEKARMANVPLYLEGVGTAKARNTVTVRPQVDGRVLSIDFKEGQEVKRGDALAKLDPATYQAQLDQATAKKALDEAELSNAQRDLERYAKLGPNIIAQKSIDTQRALVDKLSAQIKLDDAAIASARAFLAYTTIVAPIDGRTGIRLVDEGNLVRASDAGIVVITELRPVSVLFTLPQQQLVQVQKAQAKGPLTVEALDTDSKVTLDRGTLQVVDNQVDQATGTVRMKAEFPNANLQLWPGQFVNVRLLIATLKEVVVVPTPAVQRGPAGPFAYVLQPDDRVSQRPITVAHQSETQAVIEKGIAAGDQVVTTGFARLKDGAEVTIPAPAGQEHTVSTATVKTEPRGAGLRTACAADIQTHCANIERRSEIRACLQAKASQLSETCKTAAAEAEGRGRKRKAEGEQKE
jgi:multidrug efflux system membrane fusion protein